MQKYNDRHINSTELIDAIWKKQNFFQGKLTFTHWTKGGEAMALIVAAAGGTLLIRKLTSLTPKPCATSNISASCQTDLYRIIRSDAESVAASKFLRVDFFVAHICLYTDISQDCHWYFSPHQSCENGIREQHGRWRCEERIASDHSDNVEVVMAWLLLHLVGCS